MSLSLRTEKELARWYPLIDTPTQRALVDDDVRIKVVPAGRRSGKSERAKRYLAKKALSVKGKYFACAPTHDQAKKIFWADLKLMCLISIQVKNPSETERIIYLNNGSEIHVFGLDKPARIEGIAWDGGVIDEIADVKAGAWEAHIKPALDTFNPTRPDYKAWVWLIGVPDGLNHYYDMYQYAMTANDPEWRGYTWKSDEILPAETIAAAKRSMSEMQYNQEYGACHLPDTPVEMFNGGVKPISELVSGDKVVHINNKGERESCTVIDGGYTKEKPIYSATLETGYVVQCSPDHNFKVL